MFFDVYHGVFGYAVHNGVVRRYFRHCIMGEKSKMAAICSRSSNKLLSFSHNRGRLCDLITVMSS